MLVDELLDFVQQRFALLGIEVSCLLQE